MNFEFKNYMFQTTYIHLKSEPIENDIFNAYKDDKAFQFKSIVRDIDYSVIEMDKIPVLINVSRRLNKEEELKEILKNLTLDITYIYTYFKLCDRIFNNQRN